MSFTIFNLDTSAAQHALGTPEILEMVLSSLPPLELLRLQRTSRLWNGLITTSPQLQRNLFMRPDWCLEGKRNDPKRQTNRPGERPRNNLMLRRVLNGAYPTMTLKLVDDKPATNLVTDAAELDDNVMPKRPDLDDAYLKKSAEQQPKYWAWDISVAFPADKPPNSPTSSPAVHYEHASWRRMYLSQPPCTSLHLCRRWQRAANPAVHCDDGIIMQEFVERASKAKEHWNSQFIASDRDWHFEGGIRFSHVEE